LGEIEQFSIIQFKYYLDALNRKRLNDNIDRANIIRMAVNAKDRDYNRFIRSLERIKARSGLLQDKKVTEKDMQKLGIGKKR